jgi:hypothetical protein
MEIVRPNVDSHLLDLLQAHEFVATDFFETRKGACRLLPPLTERLAETTVQWASLIAPVAERVAATLAKAPGSRVDRLPTPLTNANRDAGREPMRRKNRKPVAQPLPPCKTCRGEVRYEDRDYCDRCLPAYQREQFDQRFSGSGLAKLEQLKAEGQDPTHGGPAAEKRSAATARRKAELREWEQRYGKLVDLSVFEREILPMLQTVPLSRLARATGLSLQPARPSNRALTALRLADPSRRKGAAPKALAVFRRGALTLGSLPIDAKRLRALKADDLVPFGLASLIGGASMLCGFQLCDVRPPLSTVDGPEHSRDSLESVIDCVGSDFK